MLAKFTSSSSPSSPQQPDSGSSETQSGLSRAFSSMMRREDKIPDADEDALRQIVAQQSELLRGLMEEKEAQQIEIGRLAQQLAESMMGKEDVQSMEEIIAQRDEFEKSLEDAKQRVAYQNVEAVEQKSRALTKELVRLRQEIIGLTLANEESLKSSEGLEVELKEVKRNLFVSQEANEKLQVSANEATVLQSRVEQLEDEVESLSISLSTAVQEKHVMEQEFLEKEKEIRVLVASESEETISLLKSTIDDIKGDRNRQRKHVSSLKKDMRVLLGRVEKLEGKPVDPDELDLLKEANARLMEDLERKNSSLADALEALQMETGGDVLGGDVYSKSLNQLIAENETLQRLARELTESVNDKEILIEEMRRTNRALGHRIIGKEEQFVTGAEDLP